MAENIEAKAAALSVTSGGVVADSSVCAAACLATSICSSLSMISLGREITAVAPSA